MLSRRFVAAAGGGTRFVVAPKNLRGYHGLSLDAYGALLQGGPDTMPQVLVRLLADHGKPDDRVAHDLWRKTLHTQYAAEPFVAFREVHRRAFSESFTRFGIRGDVDVCIDEAFDEYRHVRAYPEVHAVLRELEEDVPMAIVSNMDTMVLLDALHNNGLSFTFPLILAHEYAVPATRTGIYILCMAVANLLGPMLLGHFFDTVDSHWTRAHRYALWRSDRCGAHYGSCG